MKNKRKIRLINKNIHPLLVLAGKCCVFTKVYNVYASDLAMLKTPTVDCGRSHANKLIAIWNKHRSETSNYPPQCWPLTVMFWMIMWSIIILSVPHGYKRILKCKGKSKALDSLLLQTSKDITKWDDLHSFDSDSGVIIADNSANSIVWKDKCNFIPETYVTLSKSTSLTFDAAAGTGNAVGVGDLAISWKDDKEKTHNFVLKNVFHIPDSPLNILGISAFSKCIGDYATKGTRKKFVWAGLYFYLG